MQWFNEMVEKYGMEKQLKQATSAATEAPTRKPVEASIEAALPDALAVPVEPSSSALEAPMGESVSPTLTKFAPEARTQKLINQQVQARCELMTWVRDMKKKKNKGMRPALTKSELRKKPHEWRQSYR
ncbi:hypothetical protein EHS17_03880 [Rhodobacteraceae bacterium CH30]|nr:hypothetical protein EHS17_03880 [Rhodobacteraceae bacterium CH30]